MNLEGVKRLLAGLEKQPFTMLPETVKVAPSFEGTDHRARRQGCSFEHFAFPSYSECVNVAPFQLERTCGPRRHKVELMGEFRRLICRS
jgi:hypothetical protein